MSEGKLIYVDFYKPNFDEYGLSVIDVKHLKAIEIFTDISVQEIVFKMRQLIFEKYGDGLYINAEEFDLLCYLNVSVYFGEDISSMLAYLNEISLPKKADIEDSIIEMNEEVTLFSVDYAENKDIEELKSELKLLGIDWSLYLEGQSAFERGAGNYHQYFMFVLSNFTAGAINGIGKRTWNKLANKFEDYQNPKVSKVNPYTIKNHVSEISGINKHDLRITKISSLGDTELEIGVTSRYKEFIMRYDKESKTFTQYEEKDKSQTMI